MMSLLPKLLRAALVSALVVASATVAAQQLRLQPVDEAASDATWIRYKTRLQAALAKRDQRALLGMLDGGIRNVSGKTGVPEFRRLWKPESADSPLWAELPKLLSLGGAFVKRDKAPPEFCAPYIHYKWPENAPSGADAAITVREALLKAKPAANAETLQVLAYDLVKTLDWEVADEDRGSKQKWVKIQSGTDSGYVPEEQIRSPLEYRACFVKSRAGWRMTIFGIGE